tara:strand:- start:1148 stop:1273 length:126 start_codon:yes stop_codon:yes gene_type:complete
MIQNQNINLRIDKETKDKLKLEAKKQGISLSNYIKNVIAKK